MPDSYEALRAYIENAMPPESPIMYGMHPNAELSLLTSQVMRSRLAPAIVTTPAFMLLSDLHTCAMQQAELSGLQSH